MPEPRTRGSNARHNLNLKFLKRTIRLAKPYWVSAEKRKAWGLLLILIALLLAYTEFAVLFNEQSGEFTSALAAHQGPRFWHSITVFFILLVIGVPIDAYYYFVRDKLALNWRRWLTDQCMGRYFAERRYYHLLSDSEVDNPDQRISEDIDSFTQQSLIFVLVFANSFFQLAAFSRLLWGISHYLVLCLLIYAAIMTAVTFRIFGQKLVFLNFLQRQKEADFRFGLVRIRENAEPIAFYRGERQEQHHLQKVFGRLFDNALRIINWALGLNFFYYTNNYLAMVLPTLIIAPRVLSGELEVGRIVQATGAFAAVLSAFTVLVDNLDGLSRFAASTNRVETLAEGLASKPERAHANRRGLRARIRDSALVRKGASLRNGLLRRKHLLRRKNGKRHAPDAADPILETIRSREGAELKLDKITVKTPSGDRTLIKDLTVSLPQGKSLMIVGQSGIGKSSLLRVIAGLWDTGSGTIDRPRADEMLFLPQNAYVAAGNLRVQLEYPHLDNSLTEEKLREALALVDLSEVIERCGGFDTDFDFVRILSAGERQRLAFARIFLHHSRYVLLDEATSALDVDSESALYERLSKISATLVSVTHHPSLVKYHDLVLELKTNGEWRLRPAAKFHFTEDLV